MREVTVILIAILCCLSCSEEEEQINMPPTCTITSPEDGAIIEQGTKLTIAVETADLDGDNLVLYCFGQYRYISESEAPCEFDWDTWHAEPGSYNITAEVSDARGGKAWDSITVIIKAYEIVYGTVGDFDGNTYQTVQIGTQEWMSENLKATHYPDGKTILLVTNDGNWAYLIDNVEAYCYYNNNANGEAAKYGALYTYAAANKVCPTGWHLPSQAEWEVLFDYVSTEVGNDNLADALKDTTGWDVGWIEIHDGGGSNIFGFSAIASGMRSSNDTMSFFIQERDNCFWWTSSESAVNIDNSYNYFNKTDGLSVRCVKD